MKQNSFIYPLLFLCAAIAITACESNLADPDLHNAERLTSGDIIAVDTDEAEIELYGDNSPQEVFNDFVEMVEKVESMTSEELDSLESFKVLQIGLPIQKLKRETTYFDEEVLEDALYYLKRLSNTYESIAAVDLNFLNYRIEGILKRNDGTEGNETNFLSATTIRAILKNWTSDATENKACSELFNHVDDFVLLSVGENLNIANYTCPSHTSFVLRRGTYIRQSVRSSKSGNKWIGMGDVVFDGDNNTYRAFYGGFDQNTLALIEIKNYYLHGIFSLTGPSDVIVNRVTFRNIAPDSSGQDFGAIKLDNAKNVIVSDSYFENVASAVRFRFSQGPLQVINNTALNTGRNFFQCDDCRGAGIRINRNSMERTGRYGITDVEDWINIFKSRGAENDWIQVNHNRARGHGPSGTGSFIMLGDSDGGYQEAVGNIGVNPGQVGIGIAGGHHIKVEANKMYSTAWESSNVGYYSAKYSPSCSNHTFPASDRSTSNRANWICGDSVHCRAPAMNHAWTDGKCGIQINDIRRNVIVDRSMGPEIWNEW